MFVATVLARVSRTSRTRTTAGRVRSSGAHVRQTLCRLSCHTRQRPDRKPTRRDGFPCGANAYTEFAAQGICHSRACAPVWVVMRVRRMGRALATNVVSTLPREGWGRGEPVGNGAGLRCERLSFAYFSLPLQRKVGAAPHRGNANQPETKSGCHRKAQSANRKLQTANRNRNRQNKYAIAVASEKKPQRQPRRPKKITAQQQSSARSTQSPSAWSRGQSCPPQSRRYAGTSPAACSRR
jgi:hypothetical protein